MKFSKFLSSFLVLGLVGILISTGVSAQTDTVTATVTVSNSSITLDQSSFAYGSTPANTATTTLGLFEGAGIVATNGGSVADFDILGASTADWTLNTATSSADNYIHKFCNDTDNNCTGSSYESPYTDLTTSYQELKASVANAGTVAFQLALHTPNPSTVYTEQSAVVTVQASAI